MVEEARKHIEEQIDNTDTPIGQVGAICLAWLEYSQEEAAPLLMAEGKTLEGALEAMREYANKERGGKHSFAVGPMQAMEQVLEHFGHDDPIGVVEGGFAYFCLQKQMEQVRPANTQNTQPAADLRPTKPKKTLNLSLEDLGL